LDNKELISKDDMIKKIKEAVASRKDPNFSIIVRTDANLVEGLQKTIERIKAYEAVGADIIFPESMKDEKEFENIRKNSKVFLLANMTEFGKTPLSNIKELASVGVDMVLYPLSAFRAMSKAALNIYETLKIEGDQKKVLKAMQTRNELYEFLDYNSYEEKLDKLFEKNKSSD